MWSKRKLVIGVYCLVAGLVAVTGYVTQNVIATGSIDDTTPVLPAVAAATVPGVSEVAVSVADERSIVKASLQSALRDFFKGDVPPPVAEVAEPTTDTTSDAAADAPRSILWCDATVPETTFVSMWPEKVSVETVGTERVISYFTNFTGTASVSAPAVLPLVRLPRTPTVLAEGACLQHGYIGVTPTGRLIHNNDVILYADTPADELIGYAFDGNPIYGKTSEPLDNCGGRKTATGYGYYVSDDDNFILSCFKSEPHQVLQRG